MANFLGIHVSRSQQIFHFCLLNQALEIRALENGGMQEVLGYAASDETHITAMDAPSHLNVGLMRLENFRSQFDPPPTSHRWVNLRFGEYELIRKGMRMTRTPNSTGACPQWMRVGLQLFSYLEDMSYHPAKDNAPKIWLEVPGEAAFHSIAGCSLQSEVTIEGRIQRQLILYRLGLQVSDPMVAFEEITRYRLERGKFPFQNICTPENLNAMVAAYTAWLAANRLDQLQEFGKDEEGKISLPVQLIED